MSENIGQANIEVGACSRVFRPNPRNAVAGFILAVLFILGAFAAIVFPLREAYLANWDLPVNAKQGWSWFAVGLLFFLGCFLLAMGIWQIIFSRFLYSHRVEMCANGFRYFPSRSDESILWSEVALIRETICYQRPPILKGPAKFLLPKIASTSYDVIAKSGKEYGFNANSVKDLNEFAELLREVATRHILPWESVEEHL